MAVSYIDTHNAIYHPYIMRRRGSKNFGGDEAAATAAAARRPAHLGAEGARRGRGGGEPRPSPPRQWSSPQGRRRERSRAGRGGRAGGGEAGGGRRGGVLINFGKFWHKFSLNRRCLRRAARGGRGSCQEKGGRVPQGGPSVAASPLTSHLSFIPCLPQLISMENNLLIILE